jgi:hypothetical protein
MADTKITALTAITTVDPAVDVLPIVDISDTTMAASGTTKKITSNQILGAGGTATLASATITGALGAAGLNVTGATIPANGVYLGSANNLSFSAASTLGMTLNSTGLGVGRSPSYKLDVAGVGNFDQLRVSAAAATNVALVNTTSGLTYTVYSANTASNGFNGFGIFDGSSYVLRIDSSGNTTLASATITGNTTLGDAQTDTATINGQLTARQGEFPSAVRAAASDYAAVTFDGATASTRIASACQAIGTGAFSLWSRFRVPASNPASSIGIIGLSSTNSTMLAANAVLLSISSSGTLSFLRYGATTSDVRQAIITGFLSAYSGQVVDIVVTRTGTTLKIYINGTDTAYTETTGGTPPAWSDTIASDFCNVGCFTSGATTIFTGRIYRSVVFNRALSASDVTELITTGVNPADQWGTQTAVYTSDFSAGADGWGAANGTAAGNIDGIGGQDNNLRYTIGSGANSGDGLSKNNIVIPSKRYRFNFAYYLPSGQTQTTTLRAFVGLASVVTGLNVTNAWTDVSAEGVATVDTLLRVNQNFVGTGNGTDVFYIRAVTVTRIGAIVDLDFTIGAGYQATDRSTNNLHGTLFNGVEFTQPKRMAVLYATTSAATNQQVFGTLAIPANAIIEDIIVNSTGTATVTVRDAAAGNVIVNAASVVAGRQKLTIAQPFSSGGQLWVQSSTTATLQFTILYTIAA